MERKNNKEPLASQMKKHVNSSKKKEEDYDGNFGTIISTGSTLLDLAISGGRIRGGGLPGGILVEAFGPSSSGKSILLCEIAGAVQRQGGEIIFNDPEARLNKQFARQFDLDVSNMNYSIPDTVPEVFEAVRSWKPESKKKDVIHGVFADSLAALSTDMEMKKKEGDKMGGRRAKEFSEESRKTCRIIKNKNYLMVCSNQIRQNMDAGPFGQKYTTPGGESIGFYSSLRLRFYSPIQIKKTIDNYYIKTKEKDEEDEKKKKKNKDVFERVLGIETEIEVYKSSVWKPFRTANVIFVFDYGVDDVQANLKFIKDVIKSTVYTTGKTKLDKSLEVSIKMVEQGNLIDELKEETIDLWEEIESKFVSERRPKR